jgi:hypothetical protein
MQLVPSQLEQIGDRDWVELDLHANSLGARGARVIADFNCSKLRALAIGSNEITNAGAQIVAGFPALERLSLRRSQLTATGVRHLARLTKLTYLDLSCNDIGDGLDFPLALRELDLRETKLSNTGLRALLRAVGPHLVSLDIAANPLDDPRVLMDADVPKLRTLYITGTGLTAKKPELQAALPDVRIVARTTKVKETEPWS